MRRVATEVAVTMQEKGAVVVERERECGGLRGGERALGVDAEQDGVRRDEAKRDAAPLVDVGAQVLVLGAAELALALEHLEEVIDAAGEPVVPFFAGEQLPWSLG